MTTDWKPREQPAFPVVGAIGIALLFHLLLFVSMQLTEPAEQTPFVERLSPPTTFYASASTMPISSSGYDVRSVWSPVLFALPTKMGFSSELRRQNLGIQLSEPEQVKAEKFLDAVLPAHPADTPVDFSRPPLVQPRRNGPALPPVKSRGATFPEPQRIHLASGLAARLAGEITLPPSLQKGSEQPWQVDAEIHVSESGLVEHAFLRMRADSVELNDQVLRFIYGLRFSPAQSATDGDITISSLKAKPEGGKP